MRMRWLTMTAVGLALVGCHTLTEELPGSPSAPTGGSSVPPNLVVVPVPIPSPAPGGGTPVPQPVPVPNPNPNPAPTPRAPDPTPQQPDHENPGNSTNPVVRAGAKVFFVECNGVQVPGTELATSAPVGCRVHLDVTPKDANGNVTNPKHDPDWSYDNPGLIKVSGRSSFNPVLTVLSSGDLSCYATIDGIRSNTVSIHFN